jgi:FkbM family methyltransferase
VFEEDSTCGVMCELMHRDLVFDVGMNNGDDTAYYLYRGFRVVAVEADPVLATQATRRFEREVRDRRLTIVNVGITETPGIFPFWICETRSVWNSFDRAIAAREDRPHHAIDIPCRPFRSILEEYGVPFYLKLDIEGNEGPCLDDLTAADLPEYLSVETTPIITGQLDRLRNLGYTGFKCINQANLLPLEIPASKEERFHDRIRHFLSTRSFPVRVARKLGAARWLRARLEQSRKGNGWSFPYGSSGPFGEDTPGRWQDYSELVETLARFEDLKSQEKPSLYWSGPKNQYWMDIHARRAGK